VSSVVVRPAFQFCGLLETTLWRQKRTVFAFFHDSEVEVPVTIGRDLAHGTCSVSETKRLSSIGESRKGAFVSSAAHPHIRPYALDLSEAEEKSSDVLPLFQKAAENTPALVISRPRRSGHDKGRSALSRDITPRLEPRAASQRLTTSLAPAWQGR
jgi:hypothetical protein